MSGCVSYTTLQCLSNAEQYYTTIYYLLSKKQISAVTSVVSVSLIGHITITLHTVLCVLQFTAVHWFSVSCCSLELTYTVKGQSGVKKKTNKRIPQV